MLKPFIAIAAAILCTTAQAAPRHTVIDQCSWAHPGADRYTGTVADALEAQTDMPADVRDTIARRMADLTSYDDIATITRDSIIGKRAYWPDLSMMHFGSKGRVCIGVDRSMWQPTDAERALIWCEGEYCVALPTVCGNVSRVYKLELPVSDALPDDVLDALWPAQHLDALPPQPGLPVAPDSPRRSLYGAPYYYGVPYWLPYGYPSPTAQVGPVVPVPPMAVPEPGTWALVVAGLMALWRRRGPCGK